MNELQTKNSVKVLQGSVEFLGYEQLKVQALEVAKIIRETEVNEETIKNAKKLLASANKAVNELEDRRISIKREIMTPYQDFELKVKEIVGIVKEADNEIRSKVRELEQLERDKKENQLRDIWELRIRPYKDITKILSFEDWLEPSYLNKSIPINKVEENMTQWLEVRKKDIGTINSLGDSVDILAEYATCLDLSESIRRVQERNKTKETISKTYGKPKTKVTVFYIEDETQAKFTEMLLKENKINYIKEIK